jgi:hypothetical protein
MNFNYDQHRQYIFMSRRVGGGWLDVFSGNTEFYSSHYWDLLTEMWFIDKPVMVSDALKYMKSIKSPFTARKYLQKVIDEKLVVEKKNPQDERSMLVELSGDVRKKLDKFFDGAIGELFKTVDDIKSKK